MIISVTNREKEAKEKSESKFRLPLYVFGEKTIAIASRVIPFFIHWKVLG